MLYWILNKNRADLFFAEGQISFGHCERYNDSALTTAQQDSEDKRSAKFDSDEVRILVGKNAAEAIEVPFESVEVSSVLPKYFIRCLSTDYQPARLAEFNCDAAIEFFDPGLLISAIEEAISEQLNTGAWRLVRRNVHYVSKHELIRVNDIVDRIFVKDKAKYGTQAEFRLALIPDHNYPGINDAYVVIYLRNVTRFARRFI